MSSKYTEAFDSLKSDDYTRRMRTERILSSQNASADKVTVQNGAASAAKVRKRFFAGKRGIALLTALIIFIAAVAVAVPVWINNSGNLLKAMSLLKDTYVDMEGVAAFGVWNAPDSDSASARITNVAYVRPSSYSVGKPENELTDENDDGVISGDWSDEDRYDWESDYDWDPTKANVLIAITDDGKINEVVYERTNARGQVRQDVLGNAAMVYTSKGFTYVMYVDDSDWDFWKDINFAQEMRYPNGFHCHHEMRQTIVIHNETGKVFALKDIIPQVNELSGATNYTMQAQPFENDFLLVRPMYGNEIPQWYTVIYDEQLQKIRYELMLPADSDAVKSYNRLYFARAARRDRYGQQYLLEGYNNSEYPRIAAGTVDLPPYTVYGKTLVFSAINGLMFGSDDRVYAFDDGKLKVFGENFELRTVEAGTQVTFEGISPEIFSTSRSAGYEGIVYRLQNGYLYSMFGEVWKVDEDGTMHEYAKLEGSFPRYADDGYMLNGEIIAFVDTKLSDNGYYSISGRMVQIRFDSTNGTPRAVITHIISASEISVQPNNRMVIQQNEHPYSFARGDTKYFLITVQDGKPNVEYFAYGRDGGVQGLTKPITEPLKLS